MNSLFLKLQLLLKSFAVSGYEWELGITKTIQTITRQTGERIGNNLIYTLNSGKFKILVSAHMDEVGFIITQFVSEYARIMPIGSINIKSIIGKRLAFCTSNKIVLSDVITKAKSFSDLKVYGLPNISVGDVGTFEKEFSIDKDIIQGPSLDNKVGCLCLIEIFNYFRNIELKKSTLIFCFTSREETGLNGVISAIKKYNPDICIDIDSAYARPMNLKDKKNWLIPKIEDGPAIQLLGDGFVLRDIDRTLIEKTAKENNIPFQYEIPDGESGATNAKSLLNAGYDVMQINIPVAFQHTEKSKASMKDITQTIKLIKEILLYIDNSDYVV